MGGEGRVITAAVLHMKHQGDVENLGLEVCVPAVGTQGVKNILCCRQLRLRRVDVETLAIVVMGVSLIAIDREHREQGNELQGLAQYVGNGDVVATVVVGVQGQDASCQGVHHILTGSFHNDIPDKMGGQGTVGAQKLPEGSKLPGIRQFPKEQQIGDFLEAEAAFRYEATHQLLDIHAPVEQLSLAGNQLTVHHIVGVNLADLRETGQHALAADVAQSPFYIVFFIKLCVNLAGFLA